MCCTFFLWPQAPVWLSRALIYDLRDISASHVCGPYLDPHPDKLKFF